MWDETGAPGETHWSLGECASLTVTMVKVKIEPMLLEPWSSGTCCCTPQKTLLNWMTQIPIPWFITSILPLPQQYMHLILKKRYSFPWSSTHQQRGKQPHCCHSMKQHGSSVRQKSMHSHVLKIPKNFREIIKNCNTYQEVELQYVVSMISGCTVKSSLILITGRVLEIKNCY